MAAARIAPALSGAGSRLGSLEGSVQLILDLPASLFRSEEPAKKDSFRSTPASSTKTSKSFKLHLGGNLVIPSANANARPQYDHPIEQNAITNNNTTATQVYHDPFEGLPFRGFADKVGAAIMPAIEAAREEQRAATRNGRTAAEQAVPFAPEVPHFLPFTRWAAKNPTMQSTFVADSPATRKKARLSWYHPDDGMVPRDWFKNGLLEDIKYYNPFGLWGGNANDGGVATGSTVTAAAAVQDK